METVLEQGGEEGVQCCAGEGEEGEEAYCFCLEGVGIGEEEGEVGPEVCVGGG